MLKSVRIPYLYETPSKLTATPGLIHASVPPLCIFKYYFSDTTQRAHSFLLFSLSKDNPLLLLKTRGSSSPACSAHEIQFCVTILHPNLSLNFIVHTDLCSISSADLCSKEQTLTYLPCVQKICIAGDTHALVIQRMQLFTSLLFQGREDTRFLKEFNFLLFTSASDCNYRQQVSRLFKHTT